MNLEEWLKKSSCETLKRCDITRSRGSNTQRCVLPLNHPGDFHLFDFGDWCSIQDSKHPKNWLPSKCDAMESFWGLSYASHLVIPRSIMQEMPLHLQFRMAMAIEEMREHIDSKLMPDNHYVVLVRGKDGKVHTDTLGEYRHGNPLAQKIVKRKVA